MKTLTKTAKELAWKAFCDALIIADPRFKEDWAADDYEYTIRERFENWWSDNYGNRDTVQFNPTYSVYVEGKKYIQAE
jgi:hypothetical protein